MMSTPSSSSSGNITPASTTMIVPFDRNAIMCIPNSPSPPRGTTSSVIFLMAPRRSPPKLGGEPSEARREVFFWNHPVCADFVEASPYRLPPRRPGRGGRGGGGGGLGGGRAI